MLYLMLVVVFSKLSKKWWFFLILGWGEGYIIKDVCFFFQGCEFFFFAFFFFFFFYSYPHPSCRDCSSLKIPALWSQG